MLGSDNNADTFWVDLGAGQPAQVLGRDLYEYSGISSTFSAGTVAIYGDLAEYRPVDHIGRPCSSSSRTCSTSHRTPLRPRGWLLWWRTAADILDKSLLALASTLLAGDGHLRRSRNLSR